MCPALSTTATSKRAITLFAAVARHHDEIWAIDNAPRFGANALRVRGKIYAALTRKFCLLLKLPPARVAGLLADKRAKPMESGGRVMRGWITLAPNSKAEWTALADEARAFVTSEMKSGRKPR